MDQGTQGPYRWGQPAGEQLVGHGGEPNWAALADRHEQETRRRRQLPARGKSR
ncbi:MULTISPECIES: hypothetical protein [Kitasatospora]|uniref:Uncharacterized protein n=1 Tax=Kitasatospora cystarginea TaxID=58350 RepID=A0ABN3E2Z5_9ACTN